MASPNNDLPLAARCSRSAALNCETLFSRPSRNCLAPTSSAPRAADSPAKSRASLEEEASSARPCRAAPRGSLKCPTGARGSPSRRSGAMPKSAGCWRATEMAQHRQRNQPRMAMPLRVIRAAFPSRLFLLAGGKSSWPTGRSRSSSSSSGADFLGRCRDRILKAPMQFASKWQAKMPGMQIESMVPACTAVMLRVALKRKVWLPTTETTHKNSSQTETFVYLAKPTERMASTKPNISCTKKAHQSAVLVTLYFATV
mmetsp:Transcript_60230/g.161344  ORF Transcript_60230/g.161344 Transcript_60230/m.161344 type:complete len:257 (+) Transcript_60230:165-935(+)